MERDGSWKLLGRTSDGTSVGSASVEPSDGLVINPLMEREDRWGTAVWMLLKGNKRVEKGKMTSIYLSFSTQANSFSSSTVLQYLQISDSQ